MSKMSESVSATQRAKRTASQPRRIPPKFSAAHYRRFAHHLLQLCRNYHVHLDPHDEWSTISINDGFRERIDATVEFEYPDGATFKVNP